MSNTPAAVSTDEASIAETASSDLAKLRRLVLGLFLISACSALYFARDFFMPVVLAFLVAMTLTPIVRFLRKRGVPSALSATLLVVAFATVFGLLAYVVSGPAITLVNDAPSIGRTLAERLRQLQRPIERINDIMQQFDTMTGQVTDPNIEQVALAQPGVVSRAAGSVLSIGTSIGITLVLALFLLASGQMFYEKIVQSFGRMSDKKRALRVVYDVEREISRYLLTIALINSGLGVAIGTGLWIIGVPNAILWGVMAALFNFLPYIGALTTMLVVGVISIVSFDSLSYALLGPGFVLFCNLMEGQLLTPLILGRRLELNAVAIFIAVAFWSWLWGLVGALIAVPLLVVIKVFCDNFESLQSMGNFLAAQQSMEPAETAPDPALPEAPKSGPAVLDVVTSAQP
ncbi:AI-2E family transporter [Tianweitania sp. BSSL-BM11]|uniref:AI-2E family transporter n=1 Tax=Tianweitania aestuarii TaxID=2814886 RepID=A0ABS5RSS5_9HYPH|nr:AI-2E family transporter [Tianweitania aestuarii]MBS9719341.1 AI-2E family transporter [Tianweitania aestuarii]